MRLRKPLPTLHSAELVKKCGLLWIVAFCKSWHRCWSCCSHNCVSNQCVPLLLTGLGAVCGLQALADKIAGPCSNSRHARGRKSRQIQQCLRVHGNEKEGR